MDFSLFFEYPDAAASHEDDELVFLAHRSDADWAKLLECTTTLRFQAGETVLAYDDTERALYIVTSGTLEVLIPRQRGGSSQVAMIETGSIFGELSFLDGKGRSASVRAVSDGEMQRLGLTDFEILATRDPELSRAVLFELARILATRLRQADSVIARWIR